MLIYLTLRIDEACFICEKDNAEGSIHRVDGSPTCAWCPNLKIESLSGQDLLKHMGTHILNDTRLLGTDKPCGLCLNAGQHCEIFLIQHASTISINQTKSHCPNICNLLLKKAEEFMVKQPCTNHPLLFPICPRGAEAIWKYNLHNHIVTKHSSYNAALHEPLWRLHQDEEVLMKAEWDKVKRHRLRPAKEVAVSTLQISDIHSLLLALR